MAGEKMTEEGTADENTTEENAAEGVLTNEKKRVRAWVLVKATESKTFSKALAKKYRDERREHEFGGGGPNLVVVRADIVDGDDVNVVVPVDTVSGEKLKEFVGTIKDIDGGATVVSVLTVVDEGHNPDPPHGSSTYVSWQELITDPVVDYFPGGRHPNSPGRNPWG